MVKFQHNYAPYRCYSIPKCRNLVMNNCNFTPYMTKFKYCLDGISI